MFKDIQKTNFELKTKDFWYWNWNVVIIDDIDYKNYVASTLKEFTTFFYIFSFFLFVYLMFNFIKQMFYNR